MLYSMWPCAQLQIGNSITKEIRENEYWGAIHILCQCFNIVILKLVIAATYWATAVD